MKACEKLSITILGPANIEDLQPGVQKLKSTPLILLSESVSSIAQNSDGSQACIAWFDGFQESTYRACYNIGYMRNVSNTRQIVSEAIKATPYGRRYKWEVALDHTTVNAPFRPCEDSVEWDGSMSPLRLLRSNVKPGHYLECWIYEMGGDGELVDNVYIWIHSATKATVQVCGKSKKEVNLL